MGRAQPPELENALEAAFFRLVRRSGGRAYKLSPSDRGMPDRLVLFPGGRIYLVELKRERGFGKLRPDQQVWHSKAAILGVQVVVLYGKGEILDWVREVSNVSNT